MTHFRNPRKGFVLASTVLLIAIAGILLAGFARLGVNKSIETIREVQNLQTKWAADSVERLVFNAVDDLLIEDLTTPASGKTRFPLIPTVLDRIDLKTISLEVLLADESAKLDLNLVGSLKGNAGIKSSVKNICPDGFPFLELKAKTRRRDSRDNDFLSWDQIFEGEGGTPLPPSELIKFSQRLTCWGKKVCLGAASDEVLTEACKTAIGAAAAGRVSEIRQQHPGISRDELLTKLALPSRQSDQLRKILSTKSISQSIWLKATHHRSGAQSYWLVVREGFVVDGGAEPVTYRYQAFKW